MVGIYEEILPKLIFGSPNQEKNVWEIFEIAPKIVKSLRKIMKNLTFGRDVYKSKKFWDIDTEQLVRKT